MPRSFWSGTVSFGLVSIPVELYPANRPRQASLRMLSPEGAPLRREYHHPETGRAIATKDVVRGYEVEKGEFVVLSDEELEGVEPEKTRDIALDRFVPVDELDPIFFDRAYFLAPRENAGKAYRLLADVMERKGLAGIARFVMRSKEYLVAIIASDGIMRAETMRWGDEIRTPEDVGLPEPVKPEPAVVKKMAAAVRAASAKTMPEDALRDEYLEALRGLAEEKREEGTDLVETGDGEDDEESGGVIDLMDALRRSMAGAGGGAKSGGAAGSKGAGRSGAAAKRAGPKRAPDRSGGGGESLGELTKAELYERAQALDVPGRSGMSKSELIEAIRRSA